MHTIEPYYAWRNHYVASEDPKSPFFERIYNEMSYHMKIYDHYIHPQWDSIGSQTLFIKILWVDYEEESAIIELLGEWNDCLHTKETRLVHRGIGRLNRTSPNSSWVFYEYR